MGPTLGGGTQDTDFNNLLKEFLQKIFGEEMGGVRGTQTPLCYLSFYLVLSSVALWVVLVVLVVAFF